MAQLYVIIPVGDGERPDQGLPGGPPGHVGGGPMPGWGDRPVDPGYGHPGWSPVDPGWGGGPPVYPSHGLPGGGHISTGPIYPGGHPDQGLPGGGHISGQPIYPGGRPDNSLPGGGHISTGPVWGGRPDNTLPAPPPEGSPPVEMWPPRPTTWPPQSAGGVEISNPIVLPAPPEGQVVLVWVPGVGYRYATIGAAQPK